MLIFGGILEKPEEKKVKPSLEFVADVIVKVDTKMEVTRETVKVRQKIYFQETV